MTIAGSRPYCPSAKRYSIARFALEIEDGLQCFPAGQARGLKAYGGGAAQGFRRRLGPMSAVAAESAHAEHVEVGHAIFRIWML